MCWTPFRGLNKYDKDDLMRMQRRIQIINRSIDWQTQAKKLPEGRPHCQRNLDTFLRELSIPPIIPNPLVTEVYRSIMFHSSIIFQHIMAILQHLCSCRDLPWFQAVSGSVRCSSWTLPVSCRFKATRSPTVQPLGGRCAMLFNGALVTVVSSKGLGFRDVQTCSEFRDWAYEMK